MIPLEKVKKIVDNFESLEKELASGNINTKDLVKKSKEYSTIDEIISKARKYLSIKKEKEDDAAALPEFRKWHTYITTENTNFQSGQICPFLPMPQREKTQRYNKRYDFSPSGRLRTLLVSGLPVVSCLLIVSVS